MPKRDAVRFWHKARELERRSRTAGRQDGRLGRNGLAVLHALIFDFLNHKTGRLDPAYEDLAKAAAISVRSVARGIQKLREAGILSWVRRCIADQDETGRFVLRQISNAYEILTAKLITAVPDRPEAGTWGDHPSEGDAIDRAAAAGAAGLSTEFILRQLENETGLSGALARLGRANFLKKT
jgi:helix-turn-helix protein